jgi:flagellar motor switch protein FliG
MTPPLLFSEVVIHPTDWVTVATIFCGTLASITASILAYLKSRDAERAAKEGSSEAKTSATAARECAVTLSEKVDANTELTKETQVAVNGRLEKLIAEARAAAFAEGKLAGMSESRAEVRAEAREDRPTLPVPVVVMNEPKES